MPGWSHLQSGGSKMEEDRDRRLMEDRERQEQGTKREPRMEDMGFSVNNILHC